MIPCVILFDVDETLLIKNELPQNYKQIYSLINELKKYKIDFGICTNRPYDSNLRKIIKVYNITGIVITEGGLCVYHKTFFGYKRVNKNDKYKKINRIIKSLLKVYIKKNSLTLKISFSSNRKNSNCIYINKNRLFTSTLYFTCKYGKVFDDLQKHLYNNIGLDEYSIFAKKSDYKLCIFPNCMNKFMSIRKFLGDKSVLFVTDFEKSTKVYPNKLLKIYSVGNNAIFNKMCDGVFPNKSFGVEQILKNLRRIIMENYEVLSENCKIRWVDHLELNGKKYTQVSGYIYNEKNQLLVVKNNKSWTIPGGHPEQGETQVQTLEREVMEEACVTLKDIKYMGAVEVVENNETYYQLRYTAKVREVLPFKQEWETDQREFVCLDEIVNYIKWSKGITFNEQIEASKKIWNI